MGWRQERLFRWSNRLNSAIPLRPTASVWGALPKRLGWERPLSAIRSEQCEGFPNRKPPPPNGLPAKRPVPERPMDRHFHPIQTVAARLSRSPSIIHHPSSIIHHPSSILPHGLS